MKDVPESIYALTDESFKDFEVRLKKLRNLHWRCSARPERAIGR